MRDDRRVPVDDHIPWAYLPPSMWRFEFDFDEEGYRRSDEDKRKSGLTSRAAAARAQEEVPAGLGGVPVLLEVG